MKSPEINLDRGVKVIGLGGGVDRKWRCNLPCDDGD
jgi:hypothetical protein